MALSHNYGDISMTHTVKDNLISQIDKLPYDLQIRVLDFVQALLISAPRGVKGKSLLRFEGAISKDDLQLMSKAIEEECEKVDINEW